MKSFNNKYVLYHNCKAKKILWAKNINTNDDHRNQSLHKNSAEKHMKLNIPKCVKVQEKEVLYKQFQWNKTSQSKGLTVDEIHSWVGHWNLYQNCRSQLKFRSHTAMEHRPGELQQSTTEQQISIIAVCEVVPGQSRQHETSQARLRSFCIALELIMKGIHSENPAAMKPKIHSTQRLQWCSPSSPRVLVWQSLSSWVECVPKTMGSSGVISKHGGVLRGLSWP